MIEGGNNMKSRLQAVLSIGLALVLGLISVSRVYAQRASASPNVSLDADDIGGVVTSAKGPEAGVWVVAETKDLPTGFRKIVVTDDRGRYVVPDLPKGTYRVWVRGYGLVDSKPVQAMPGTPLNLTAVVAPSPVAAAQYYPASYWFSMLEIPPASAFPIGKIQTRQEWIAHLKTNIQLVQLGDKATREIPEKLGKFKSSEEAWAARVKNNESPLGLYPGSEVDPKLQAKLFGEWTDRIAKGEVPPTPPRPQGVERNVVITQWDVSNDKAFIHDVSASDRRNPTVNANGLVWGLEQFSADTLDYLDPNTATWGRLKVPTRDKNMKPIWGVIPPKPDPSGADAPMTWGDEEVRPAAMRLHNTTIDGNGDIWLTGRFRKPEDQPAFCTDPSNPYAKMRPYPKNPDLEIMKYSPKTKKFEMVDTCFSGNHIEMGFDANNSVWTGAGWVNTKLFNETGDSEKSQGWCPFGGGYGITLNPIDGTIWGGSASYPGGINRLDRGSNPPYTCSLEVYNSPKGTSYPKGVWVERKTGRVWVAFAGSGHFGVFDRTKCKSLKPLAAVPGKIYSREEQMAAGNSCPEGWEIYPSPEPKFKNVTEDVNTEWHYLNWVDQFNTLGLGEDIPLAPGTNSDSMVAFLPETKKWVVMRVPYPLGFFSRGMDGRIDDPNGGWKGRGLWSNYASISPWNYEGGKGQTPKIVKFQVRPDPLAH